MSGATLATTADEAVIEDFFETFSGRPLSRDELTRLTQENVGDRTKMTPEQLEKLDATLKEIQEDTTRLRQDDPTERGLFRRHDILQTVYFEPTQENTLTRAIILEKDPVVVADARSKRVMTRRDIPAFIDIANLSRLEAPPPEPHHRDLTDAQIDIVVQELNRSFGPNPTSSSSMPQFYSEAAVFWTGLRREWTGLTSHERELMWQYSSYSFQMENIPDDLYAKVWGLDSTEAKLRSLDDTMARTLAVALLGGEISMYVWFMGDLSSTFTNFWLSLGAW